MENVNLHAMTLKEMESLQKQINREFERRKNAQGVEIDYKYIVGHGQEELKKWAKIVNSIDTTQKGGYVFQGKFLPRKITYQPIGTIIVGYAETKIDDKQRYPEVMLFIVREDGPEAISSATGYKWSYDLMPHAIKAMESDAYKQRHVTRRKKH